MTMQPREMSVTRPVGQAMDRVKKVLFQPFDLGKWFVIGFCAWLAFLGEGGGFPGGFHFGGHHGHGAHSLRAWIRAGARLCAAQPRVDRPAGDRAHSGEPRDLAGRAVAKQPGTIHVSALRGAQRRRGAGALGQIRSEANSLFLFRLVIGLINLVVMLPLVGGLVLVVLRMVFREAVSPVGLLLAVVFVCVMMAAGIVFWIIGRLTTDFVVPLQFLRRSRCLDAWRELRGLLPGNLGNLVLYFLFQIVLAIVVTALVMGVVLVTCCVAGCLFALPYLGTVFLLPILVFDRAYSLHYLAQLGPDYDVFAPPATGISAIPPA